MQLWRLLHIGSLHLKHLLKLQFQRLVFNHCVQLLVKRFIQHSSGGITRGDGELR